MLGSRKNLVTDSLSPCRAVSTGRGGEAGGQACQIGAGGFRQGAAAELDTLQREDVQHLLLDKFSNRGKPRILNTVVEEIYTMLVEDIGGS